MTRGRKEEDKWLTCEPPDQNVNVVTIGSNKMKILEYATYLKIKKKKKEKKKKRKAQEEEIRVPPSLVFFLTRSSFLITPIREHDDTSQQAAEERERERERLHTRPSYAYATPPIHPSTHRRPLPLIDRSIPTAAPVLTTYLGFPPSECEYFALIPPLF